jgi:ribosomal-protein-alanine N-acetyltransferase
MGADDPDLILETERLILRRQRADDVSFLTDLWADHDATRYLGGPRERGWLQAELEESAANPTAHAHDLWPVLEKATGRGVGHCGLLEKEVDGAAEIELNYVFAASAWGRGYAAEMGLALTRFAFETDGLERVIALIDPGNESSERVAIKIGMRFERDVVRPGGALLYALERQR